MKPNEFIARLQTIAQDARHHPEPAVAVSLLAQLLLDLTMELQPLAQKYGMLLQASGFLDNLEASANQAAADMQATAVTPAEAALIADVLSPLTVTKNPAPDPESVTEIPATTPAA